MASPSDVRLAFWTELAAYHRGMHLAVADVPAPAGLGSYLWPRETTPAVRAAMARALLGGDLDAAATPFLYWLTIHHLAPPADPSQHLDGATTAADGRGLTESELVAALLQWLPAPALADWLGYHQARDAVVPPPACYRATATNPVDMVAYAAKLAAAAGVAAAWAARCERDPAVLPPN